MCYSRRFRVLICSMRLSPTRELNLNGPNAWVKLDSFTTCALILYSWSLDGRRIKMFGPSSSFNRIYGAVHSSCIFCATKFRQAIVILLSRDPFLCLFTYMREWFCASRCCRWRASAASTCSCRAASVAVICLHCRIPRKKRVQNHHRKRSYSPTRRSEVASL